MPLMNKKIYSLTQHYLGSCILWALTVQLLLLCRPLFAQNCEKNLIEALTKPSGNYRYLMTEMEREHYLYQSGHFQNFKQHVAIHFPVLPQMAYRCMIITPKSLGEILQSGLKIEKTSARQIYTANAPEVIYLFKSMDPHYGGRSSQNDHQLAALSVVFEVSYIQLLHEKFVDDVYTEFWIKESVQPAKISRIWLFDPHTQSLIKIKN